MTPKIKQKESHETEPKKRVLFVITQSEWGGAQKFMFSLVSKLNKENFDILVAVGNTGDGEFSARLEKSGVTVHHLRFLTREIDPVNDFKAVFELRKLIKEFRPRTVFLNSSKAGLVGSLAARCFKKLKVIYRIGGWAFNDPNPWLKRKFYTWAERYTAGLKDYIVLNNKRDFDQAKKLKIRPRKGLELIYNGVDPYKIEFLEKNAAKIKLSSLLKHGQKDFLQSDFIVGTIANFYETKGLKYLIEAAGVFVRESANNPIFLLIGDGPEREKLELQIKESGLENKVLLPGRVSEAYAYLSAFDVFVLPSVKEGFPWAVLEAMAAKLPIIATDVGGNSEIIDNNKNGILVRPGEPADIATALNHIEEKESIRKEMGFQAHQTVIFKYDLNKMVEQIEELL